MPTIPVPDEYYTYQLESLYQELTPSQQKKLANWILLIAHYGRELIARAGLGAGLQQYLLDNPNLEESKVERVRHNIDERFGKQNLEDLGRMFDAIQEIGFEYSIINSDDLKNDDN